MRFNPAQQLDALLTKLQDVTKHLLHLNHKQGPEYFLADAVLYLEFFGITAIAWQWLLQGVFIQKALINEGPKTDVNYYRGKMTTLRYFFGYEVPKTSGLAKRLMNADGLTVEMEVQMFND